MFARFLGGAKSPSKEPETPPSQQATPAKGPAASSTKASPSAVKATAATSTKTAEPAPVKKAGAAESSVLKVSSPQVLYCDLNNKWEPLSTQYFSSTNFKLVGSDRESSVPDIISFYCPLCVNRFMEDEVALHRNECPTCKECPVCASNLTVSASTYECGYCSWKSTTVSAHDMQDSIRSFKMLTEAYQGARKKSAPLNKGRPKGDAWKLSDIENKVALARSVVYDPAAESRLMQTLKSSSTGPSDTSAVSSAAAVTSLAQRLRCVNYEPTRASELEPLPVRMRTKRIVRCRADMLAGALSIVLQPKAFPLEGDSSHKLMKGKWWAKNSCAVVEIPSLVVRKLPDTQALLRGETAYLHLVVFSPRETSTGVTLTQASREDVAVRDSAVHSNVCWLTAAVKSCSIEVGAHEDELLQTADDVLSLERAALAPAPSDPSSWGVLAVADTCALCIPVALDKTPDPAHRSDCVFKLALRMSVVDSSVPANKRKPVSAEDILLQIMFSV